MSKSGIFVLRIGKENHIFLFGRFMAFPDYLNDGDVKMSAFQELSPYFDTYAEKIKKARIQNGMTVSDLAEKSGVPLSTVSKIINGNQSSPNLLNIIALFKTLGISADETFGLAAPSGNEEALTEQVHTSETARLNLQISNTDLVGRLKLAEAETAHQKEKADFLRAQLATRRPVIYTLLSICVVMAFTLLVYIVLDLNVPDVGFIRYGRPSAAAWIVIGVIIAASAVIAWSIIHNTKQQKKVKK